MTHFLISPQTFEIGLLRLFGLTIIEQQVLWAIKMDRAQSVIFYITEDMNDDLLHKLSQTVTHISHKLNAKILIERLNTLVFPEKYIPINVIRLTTGSSFPVNSTCDIKILKKTFNELLRRNVKGLIAKNVNKRLSIPLSQFLAYFNVAPNLISYFALGLSFIASYLLFFSPNTLPIYPYLLFQLNSVLDGCDGEVAKMNLSFSEYGKKLDIFSDYITTGLIFLASYTRSIPDHSLTWLASIIFLLLTTIALPTLKYFLKVKTPIQDIEGVYHEAIYAADTFFGKIKKLYLESTKRDFYIFALFALSLFGNKSISAMYYYMLFLSLSWLYFALDSIIYIRNKKLPT